MLSVLVLGGAGTIGCGASDTTTTTTSAKARRAKARQKLIASDTRAEATARTAVTAMEVYAVDHNGDYTGATDATLKSIQPQLPPDLEVIGQVTGYSVTVPSQVSGTRFTVTKTASGALSSSCSSPGTGTCPNSGNWGS